uniref:Uncharacterized protein n=1 Tax=Monodon monoceros TaxID=40151 RepID=A0A8C6C824_MONMO
MSFCGFRQSVEVDFLVKDANSRKWAKHKTEDRKDKYLLFCDWKTVSRKVSLSSNRIISNYN